MHMSVAQAYAILEHSSVVELPSYIRRVPGSIPGVPIFQNGGMAMISEFVEYVKQVWKNKPNVSSPLNADRLNHMEDGIENNSKKIKETVTAVNELTENMVPDMSKMAPIITSSKDVNNKAYTIAEDGYITASVRTQGTSGSPFIRINIGGTNLYEGQGISGMYKYLWSSVIPVRKGMKITFTLTAGENITDGQYNVWFFK